MKCGVYKITKIKNKYVIPFYKEDTKFNSLSDFLTNAGTNDFIVISLREAPNTLNLEDDNFKVEDLNIESEQEFILESGSEKNSLNWAEYLSSITNTTVQMTNNSVIKSLVSKSRQVGKSSNYIHVDESECPF